MAGGRRGGRVRAPLVALGLTLLVVALPGSSSATPTWLAARDLSAADENATHPSVALDRAGDAVAVWSGYDGSAWRVRASERRAAGDWSAPRDLSGDALEGRGAQVAMNAAGAAVAVWEQSTASGWSIQASVRPAGGGWEAAQDLAVGADDIGRVRVALDRRGDAVALWERRRYLGPKEDRGLVQAAARPVHGAWAAPTNLTPEDANAGGPDVAFDAAGDAVAVWERDAPGSALGGIYAARRPAGGAWEKPQRLSSPQQDALVPALAVDASGTAVVAWAVYNNGIRVARQPAGRTWSTPRLLAGGGTSPAVAVDPAGDAVVLWQQGYTSVKAATRPRHGSWGRTATVSANGAFPDVALDDSGDAVAVWTGFDSGHRQVERASRRPAGGPWGRAKTITVPGGPEAYGGYVVSDRWGNAVASIAGWTGHGIAEVVPLDAAGPVFAKLSIPAHARAKARLHFSVSPSDVWSPLAGAPRWTFGDGSSAVGTSVGHAYRRAGTYRVRLSQADALGNGTSVSHSVKIGR